MDHEQWSSEQQQTTITIDDKELDLAYRDVGTGDPVIFLHGIPTWSFLWHRITPPLEGEFRTIVPDLIGYGNSDRRDSFDRSIRAQEQVLGALVDELDLDQFDVVAHDIGGGAALRYAAHSPDRLDRMVLSNVTCYGSWPVDYIVSLGLPRTVDMKPTKFEAELDRAFVDGLYANDPDQAWVAGMKAPWLREDGQRAFARAAVATNTNHTTEIDYDAIDVTLLCLWGAEDTEQPLTDGERLVEDLGGELTSLEQAGHWLVQDRPSAYRQKIREFLLN